MSYIPKNLFFIWITEQRSVTTVRPNFTYYSIQKFREVNPDWNIIEILDDNPIVEECKQYTQSKHIIHPGGMFTDILRMYVVFKYGGLYLDNDCFPVKRFDDNILKYSIIKPIGDIFAFASKQRKIDEIDLKWYNDDFIRTIQDSNFFPNYNHFINPNINKGKYKCLYNGKYMEEFNKNNCMELKDKFWSCQLQYGEKIEPQSTDDLYYFDHYRMSIWNKQNISIRNSCEMKELLSKY